MSGPILDFKMFSNLTLNLLVELEGPHRTTRTVGFEPQVGALAARLHATGTHGDGPRASRAELARVIELNAPRAVLQPEGDSLGVRVYRAVGGFHDRIANPLGLEVVGADAPPHDGPVAGSPMADLDCRVPGEFDGVGERCERRRERQHRRDQVKEVGVAAWAAVRRLDPDRVLRHDAAGRRLGLIRLGGHQPCGGYGVLTSPQVLDGFKPQETSPIV